MHGGVLSPKLFAIFVDDLSHKINSRDLGCHMSLQCTSIFLYADDILLVASSVHMLQEMLNCCETELMWLDMCINAKKSACIRFGSRYDTDCFQIVTANGDIIEWANSILYLGVYFVSGRFLNATGTMPNLATIVLLTPYSDVLVDLLL